MKTSWLARRPMRSVLVCALFALLLSACERKPPEVAGVGRYVFGSTVLKDVRSSMRCMPTSFGEIQCLTTKGVQIGGQTGHTQLYFPKDADDAHLLEVAVTLRACEVEEAAAALDQQLGPPSEVKDGGTRRFWRRKHMVVAAELPTKGSIECNVNFVDPSDTGRIDELVNGP